MDACHIVCRPKQTITPPPPVHTPTSYTHSTADRLDWLLLILGTIGALGELWLKSGLVEKRPCDAPSYPLQPSLNPNPQ